MPLFLDEDTEEVKERPRANTESLFVSYYYLGSNILDLKLQEMRDLILHKQMKEQLKEQGIKET